MSPVAVAPMAWLRERDGLRLEGSGSQGEGERQTLEVLFPMGEEGATLQFATDAPLRITPEDTGPQIQAKTVFCITTVLAGARALAPPGGIYPLALARGAAGSAPSDSGPSTGCLSSCSRPSVAIPIRSLCPSTAPLSRFTRRSLMQKGAQHQFIGRSRGGLTTGIVALVDGPGTPMGILLLPGQTHPSKGERH